MTWTKLCLEFPVLPWQVIALGPRGADGWKVCAVNPQTCMMMPIPAHTEDGLVRCRISEFHWHIVWTLPCLSFHFKDRYKGLTLSFHHGTFDRKAARYWPLIGHPSTTAKTKRSQCAAAKTSIPFPTEALSSPLRGTPPLPFIYVQSRKPCRGRGIDFRNETGLEAVLSVTQPPADLPLFLPRSLPLCLHECEAAEKKKYDPVSPSRKQPESYESQSDWKCLWKYNKIAELWI